MITPVDIHSSDSANKDNEEQEVSSEKATYICRHCGAVMTIVESFVRDQLPRAPPTVETSS
ncbi:MAG: hypothetical protein HOM18_07065 [Candidatus Marinimicrobia bacterium]|nr:hypothetical protein [Candidatus Neomarinimicrobiota bacterium]